MFATGPRRRKGLEFVCFSGHDRSDRIREDALRIHAPFRLRRRSVVLALFAIGDVYVSLCKESAYAPFSVRRRS